MLSSLRFKDDAYIHTEQYYSHHRLSNSEEDEEICKVFSILIDTLIKNKHVPLGLFQPNQVAPAISIHSMANGITHSLVHSNHVHDVRMNIFLSYALNCLIF